MKIATELYWPLTPEHWVQCYEEDEYGAPWVARILEVFAGTHDATVYGVNKNGVYEEFTFRGVRYKLFPTLSEWSFRDDGVDVVHWNSFLGIVRGFPKVEKVRIVQMHGELSTFPDVDKTVLSRYSGTDMVYFRNPYEGTEIGALGQPNRQWVPAAVNIDLVRRFSSPVRDIDVIGNVARPRKRPEFIDAILHRLGAKGFGCEWVGCHSKHKFLGILNRAKVYLHASLNEGWSRTMVEANVAGCVVAAASPSRAVRVHAEAYGGLILSADDPEAAANRLELFLRQEYTGPRAPAMLAEADVRGEINTIASVVDRALWCIQRGRDFYL